MGVAIGAGASLLGFAAMQKKYTKLIFNIFVLLTLSCHQKIFCYYFLIIQYN